MTMPKAHTPEVTPVTCWGFCYTGICYCYETKCSTCGALLNDPACTAYEAAHLPCLGGHESPKQIADQKGEGRRWIGWVLWVVIATLTGWYVLNW